MRECRCSPRGFAAKHSIEDAEELAHAGYERGLGVLTAGAEPQVKRFDGRVTADSGHGGHIQDAPYLRAATPDTTAAAQTPTITIKRR